MYENIAQNPQNNQQFENYNFREVLVIVVQQLNF